MEVNAIEGNALRMAKDADKISLHDSAFTLARYYKGDGRRISIATGPEKLGNNVCCPLILPQASEGVFCYSMTIACHLYGLLYLLII